MKAIVKISGAIINAAADCADCSWGSKDSAKVIQLAREHTRETGHTVLTDVRRFVTYKRLLKNK